MRGWYDMVCHGVKNMYLLIMGEITLYMHWLSVEKKLGGIQNVLCRIQKYSLKCNVDVDNGREGLCEP